ncbi:hypothetical protein A5647_24140 [Mycobacterium sp. 1100029.7]|nr:hypothetical protein A5647_24140 [Mycobacterium sp. 1100029.7]
MSPDPVAVDAVTLEDERVRALLAENDQLRRALESRDIIGQAKGVLMLRFSVDAAKAFELLRTLSMNQNVKLEELSRRIIVGLG